MAVYDSNRPTVDSNDSNRKVDRCGGLVHNEQKCCVRGLNSSRSYGKDKITAGRCQEQADIPGGSS